MTLYKEKILFVDEDELFCEGLLKHFNSQKSFEVIGIASDWSEALEKAETLSPEIIILNIGKVHSDWCETVRSIRRKLPHITIVMLSGNRQGIRQVMEAGTNAFLPKNLAFRDILKIIGTVNETSSLIYPVGPEAQQDEPADPATGDVRISKREKEILNLLSKGYQNKEIAVALSVKVPTVNNHLYKIYRKLGCSNRTEAVFTYFNKKKDLPSRKVV